MPQTCPQCQSEAADDAGSCPSCGAALERRRDDRQAAPAASAPRRAAGRARPRSDRGASTVPAYKFDAARWSLADRISGVATIVLFISLFLSWFGISVIGITVTASGVSAHGYLYIVMIMCILIVAYLVLRAGWDELPGGINLPHLTTMMVATLVNLVIVFIGLHLQAGRLGRRLGVRRLPRPHRGHRRRGALRDPASCAQTMTTGRRTRPAVSCAWRRAATGDLGRRRLGLEGHEPPHDLVGIGRRREPRRLGPGPERAPHDRLLRAVEHGRVPTTPVPDWMSVRACPG